MTKRVRLASGTCAVLALAVAGIAPAVAQAASSAFDVDVPITGFVEGLVVGYGDKSLAPGGKAELNLTFDAGAAGLVPGLCDGNSGPVQSSALLGLGGHATFLQRSEDRWGVGSFYCGFSGDLIEGLAALGQGLRDEYGIEAYYDAEITTNVRVGGDLQVIRTGTPGTDPAVFASVRARIIV